MAAVTIVLAISLLLALLVLLPQPVKPPTLLLAGGFGVEASQLPPVYNFDRLPSPRAWRDHTSSGA